MNKFSCWLYSLPFLMSIMLYLILNCCNKELTQHPSVCWRGGWYTTTPLDIRVPCWRGDGLPNLQMLGLLKPGPAEVVYADPPPPTLSTHPSPLWEGPVIPPSPPAHSGTKIKFSVNIVQKQNHPIILHLNRYASLLQKTSVIFYVKFFKQYILSVP